MEFADKVKQFVSSISPELLASATTEQATKNYLVMPFIHKVLGYDPYNPAEVRPELDANVGASTKYKLDYGIFQDGQPIMIMECKTYNTNFGNAKDSREWSQLHHYFNSSDARIAILTDGVIYKFYADLEKPNKMDDTPFLELDLLNFNESLIPEIRKLTNSSFDTKEIISTASELKYIDGIKRILKEQFDTPTEEFIKFFFRELCPGNKFIGQLKDEFTSYTERALEEFLREEMGRILGEAIDGKNKPKPENKAILDDEIELEHEFTEEEREGLYIMRSILCEMLDPDRVTHRDTKSYCNILLDGNGWRPIVRLHFNNPANKRIEIFSMNQDGDKTSEKYSIESLSELYKYANEFKSVVAAYTR